MSAVVSIQICMLWAAYECVCVCVKQSNSESEWRCSRCLGKNLRVGVCEILCVRMWRVESVYGFLVCEGVCLRVCVCVYDACTYSAGPVYTPCPLLQARGMEGVG